MNTMTGTCPKAIKSIVDVFCELLKICKTTLHGNVFLFVLAVKAGLLFTVKPDLYITWFIPFVKNFTSSGAINPWDSFLAAGGSVKAFPYGPAMLLVFAVPFKLASFVININPASIGKPDIVLMGLPILLADIAILYMLIHSLKMPEKKSVYIYWCSPVVLYICYIHGQLDIIPMMLLMAAIVLAANDRFLFSAVVLTLGVAAKESLLIAVPFFIIYFYKKEQSLKRVCGYILMAGLIYALFLAAFIFSEGYQRMVLGAEERTWVYMSRITFRQYSILLVPLALWLLYLKYAMCSKVNKDIMIMYIGLAFTVLLLLVPANAPGWYMWIVPFLCYYFISTLRFRALPLILFQILFVLYFLVEVPYPLKIIDPDKKSVLQMLVASRLPDVRLGEMANLTFTLLQGMIAYIALTMYIYGIRGNDVYRERRNPVIIGVGGESGSGKDTLAKLLQKFLGDNNVIRMDGDDHHRWERGNQMWRVFTHLNPGANDLYLQFMHTKSLKEGAAVLQRRYNHQTGSFSEPKIVESGKYVIISGLHPFFLSHMRKLIDLKIFLHTREELRTFWKIKRDIDQRGYTKGQVLQSIEERDADSHKYIQPQMECADLVIQYETLENLKADEITDGSPLKVTFKLDNSINLFDFIGALSEVGSLHITHGYEGVDRQYLSVHGDIDSSALRRIVSDPILRFHEFFSVNLKFDNGLKGIVQAISLCVLIHMDMYGEK